jgi:hypothetical protein
MSNGFRKARAVRWNRGSGTEHGEVVDRFVRRVERKINSEKIVRKGSEANPAYLVNTNNGSQLDAL